jgi:hypothetical protein
LEPFSLPAEILDLGKRFFIPFVAADNKRLVVARIKKFLVGGSVAAQKQADRIKDNFKYSPTNFWCSGREP